MIEKELTPGNRYPYHQLPIGQMFVMLGECRDIMGCDVASGQVLHRVPFQRNTRRCMFVDSPDFVAEMRREWTDGDFEEWLSERIAWNAECATGYPFSVQWDALVEPLFNEGKLVKVRV